jgi:hypothetical protein
MKIWFGTSEADNEVGILNNSGILYSYYYVKKKDTSNFITSYFLDSGAFSAWRKSVLIDINDYISFVKINECSIETFANLDVIGDPIATWKNQRIMENAGLNPVPCFHFGEDLKWLKKYIERYEYVALGGMVGKTKRKALIMWLNQVFKIINSDNKIHGFGITDLLLLKKYPWHSVDSTTHAVAARMGEIFISNHNKTEMFRICISNQRNVLNNVQNKSRIIKKLIIEEIECGEISMEDLINSTKKRTEFNAIQLLNWVK